MKFLRILVVTLTLLAPLCAAELPALWAERLGLQEQADADFALQLGAEGLQFVELGPQAPGAVRVDFVEGAAAHQRRTIGARP